MLNVWMFECMLNVDIWKYSTVHDISTDYKRKKKYSRAYTPDSDYLYLYKYSANRFFLSLEAMTYRHNLTDSTTNRNKEKKN